MPFKNIARVDKSDISGHFKATFFEIARKRPPVHKSELRGHLARNSKARKHRTCAQIRFSEARNYTTIVKSEVRGFENTAPVHKSELQGRLPRGSAVNWMLENTAPANKSKLRGHLAPGPAEAAFANIRGRPTKMLKLKPLRALLPISAASPPKCSN